MLDRQAPIRRPDQSADALAQQLGVSRSRLYADALAEYVAKRQHAQVTEQSCPSR